MNKTSAVLQVLRNARPVTSPTTVTLTAGDAETWIRTYPGQENFGDTFYVCLYRIVALDGWWTAEAIIQVNGQNLGSSRPIRWFGERTGCGWSGVTHWPLLDSRPSSILAGYFTLAMEAA